MTYLAAKHFNFERALDKMFKNNEGALLTIKKY